MVFLPLQHDFAGALLLEGRKVIHEQLAFQMIHFMLDTNGEQFIGILFKYIASGSAIFSPSPNAADGAVGARTTSQLANAASKSRAPCAPIPSFSALMNPPPVSTPANPYGLSDCANRPFARDCDRRGTW